jgi:hypothetical protein
MTTNRIDRREASKVLNEAAKVIRAQQGELDTLREKVATYERREHAERIVSLMEDKGVALDASMSFREKVASVLQEDDLPVLERAVRMVNPHSGTFNLDSSSSSDSDEYDGVPRSDTGFQSHLEAYLLGEA